MDKFLETTKSFAAFTAFSAVIAITIIGVSALNPVSKLALASADQQIAGMQLIQAQPGEVHIVSATNKITFTQTALEFDILPGQTNVVAGEITLTNKESRPAYAYISASMSADLNKNVRIELLDSDNKIILSDFTKDFEKQKLSFQSNATRTFKVKYLLKSPLNYTSKIQLLVK